MTSPTFKSTTEQANAILAKDKPKLLWTKLPIDSLPEDIQAMAIEAINAEIASIAAKATLQSALNDKVVEKPGKRLIVDLGRNVSSATDFVLYAWADANAGSQTRVVSFDQFIKG